MCAQFCFMPAWKVVHAQLSRFSHNQSGFNKKSPFWGFWPLKIYFHTNYRFKNLFNEMQNVRSICFMPAWKVVYTQLSRFSHNRSGFTKKGPFSGFWPLKIYFHTKYRFENLFHGIKNVRSILFYVCKQSYSRTTITVLSQSFRVYEKRTFFQILTPKNLFSH